MNIKWNTEKYESNFSFVHEYGEDLFNLITAPKGSFAVDLGCGNGALTEALQNEGYNVLGIDASQDMITTAKELHPNIEFSLQDVTDFKLDKKADVIFSNAVFHWINEDKQPKTVQNISDNLNEGGMLVCEFGGFGNCEAIQRAVENAFKSRNLKYIREWYFPTIAQYTALLEKAGMQTVYASLFDRLTEQKGENGVEEWMRMFLKTPFEGLADNQKNEIIAEAVNSLKPILYKNGKWFADYVRIRIKAVKKSKINYA